MRLPVFAVHQVLRWSWFVGGGRPPGLRFLRDRVVQSQLEEVHHRGRVDGERDGSGHRDPLEVDLRAEEEQIVGHADGVGRAQFDGTRLAQRGGLEHDLPDLDAVEGDAVHGAEVVQPAVGQSCQGLEHGQVRAERRFRQRGRFGQVVLVDALHGVFAQAEHVPVRGLTLHDHAEFEREFLSRSRGGADDDQGGGGKGREAFKMAFHDADSPRCRCWMRNAPIPAQICWSVNNPLQDSI